MSIIGYASANNMLYKKPLITYCEILIVYIDAYYCYFISVLFCIIESFWSYHINTRVYLLKSNTGKIQRMRSSQREESRQYSRGEDETREDILTQ